MEIVMANFKDIIGQTQVKEHLQTAIETGKVSHAYIIAGETGSGRHMLADAFAKTLLCENRSSDNACDICKSCLQAESHNHPDIRYITHEKATISVDDIREQLNSDIQIKPYSSAYKIYLIDQANKMTEQAQNALLKTIEEPPAYAVVILLTDNINALLPTIRSRCVTLNTKPLDKGDIADYLTKHLSMEPEQAQIAAGFCQGNMGKAIRFANSEDFQEMKEDVLGLLRKVDKLEVSEIVQRIRIFSQKKGMIHDYLDLMLLWYRDVLMFKVTKDANLLLYQEEYHDISRQASIRTYEDIENIIQAIDKAKVRLDANVNFDIVMELMVLTMKE
jgi:DNA polymerase-3 subunit delta'